MSSGGGLPGPPPLRFEDLLRCNTGQAMAAERWEERQARQRALGAEDARIADALEAEGIPVRTGARDVVAVGLVTGKTAPVESYRAIRFLPSVAQRDRRPLLNGLRYFAQHDPIGLYLRLVVVTSGKRVPLYGELRGRIQHLHRKASRFVHTAGQGFGIEVVYRGTEFTVDEALSFHVHANLLLTPRAVLSRQQWRDFLAWMRQFFRAHVHDAGRLKKPEEAIKYPFKPSELGRLAGPALAWVYEETARLKFAQPLGRFRAFWHKLDRERLKVALVARPGGLRPELVEKAASGRRGPPTPSTEMAPRENDVLCLAPPQARFSRFAEPIALVRGHTLEPATGRGRMALEALQARRREVLCWWIANGAPAPADAPDEALAAVPAVRTDQPRGRSPPGRPPVPVRAAHPTPPARELATALVLARSPTGASAGRAPGSTIRGSVPAASTGS